MAATVIVDAKRKLDNLVTLIGNMQAKLDESTKRPCKCLMCAQPYGYLNQPTFSPTHQVAKCGHQGAGSMCHGWKRGLYDKAMMNEPTCGLSPTTYDCYECRRKINSSVCLMCNQPYGANINKSNLKSVKAKCGHQGHGVCCSKEPDNSDGAVDNFMPCSLSPDKLDCYNCRNPQ